MQSNSVTPLTAKEAREHVKAMLLQYFRDAVDRGTEMIFYADLDALINDDVRKNYYWQLKKVRDILQADYKISLETVNSRGYKVIPDDQKAVLASLTARKTINSATQTWRERHDSIDMSSLSSKGITDYARECLRLSVQEDINRGESELLIQAAVESASEKKTVDATTVKRFMKEANDALIRMKFG